MWKVLIRYMFSSDEFQSEHLEVALKWIEVKSKDNNDLYDVSIKFEE